ncbi:hypothetical protein [Embleya hyalina]|uniref:Uncharacterized protein n=1 Tax=Embleya hyalina TaxID=516124 RepID=A0A401YE50_9ACTN|nr:hypothetical protein [Embleya hyalina]GCD92881.1 hypothetical protein EHYA_00524 [Embleya hyalina]
MTWTGHLVTNGNFSDDAHFNYITRLGIRVTGDNYFRSSSFGGWRTGQYIATDRSDVDVLSGNDPLDRGGLHSQMTAPGMDAMGSNVVDVNGYNTLGWLEQTIVTQKGTSYELKYFIGYPESNNHDQGFSPSIRATVMDGGFGDPRLGVPLADRVDVIPSHRTGQYTPQGLDWRNTPNWRAVTLEFVARSSRTTIRFGNAGRSARVPLDLSDPDALGHTGVELTDVSVRETVPARTYEIEEVSPKEPVTAPVNQKFGEVGFRVVDDKEHLPLPNAQVRLALKPQGTGAHFTSGEQTTRDTSTDSEGYVSLATGVVKAGGHEGYFTVDVFVGEAKVGEIDFKVGDVVTDEWTLTPVSPVNTNAGVPTDLKAVLTKGGHGIDDKTVVFTVTNPGTTGLSLTEPLSGQVRTGPVDGIQGTARQQVKASSAGHATVHVSYTPAGGTPTGTDITVNVS